MLFVVVLKERSWSTKSIIDTSHISWVLNQTNEPFLILLGCIILSSSSTGYLVLYWLCGFSNLLSFSE